MKKTALFLLSTAGILLFFFGIFFFYTYQTKKPPRLSVLCSNDHAICQAWANSYTKISGVEVSVTRLPTSEALARLRGHAHNPEFDIWIGGPAEAYVQADNEGLLAPYQVKYQSQIPKSFRAQNDTWTGVYASLLGFCSNPQLLTANGLKPPTSWQDLLSPRLKNQLSLSSPLSSGTAYSVMWTAHYLAASPTQAKQYLTQLWDNTNQFTRSGTAPAGVVKRGEATVAVTFAPYCETGPNQKMILTYPAEGTGYEIGAMALLTGSHHPQAAKDWLDYMSSAHGQESGRSTGIKQLTINRISPYSLEKQARKKSPKLIDYNIYEAAAHKDQLVHEFASHYFQYRLGE